MSAATASHSSTRHPVSLDRPAAAPPARRDPSDVAEAVAALRVYRANEAEPLDDAQRQALTLIHQRYSAVLLVTATRVLGSRDDAEDVVQDLFCALPRLAAQYRGDGLGGWLRRAVVTRALMALRRARTRRLEPHATLDRLVAPAERPAISDWDEVDRALRRLATPDRDVVVLHCCLGYSHAEISRALGLSVAACEVRLCRARKLLRVTLQASAPSGARTRSRARARHANEAAA
jgi:RNA polymerase sigma-70 factor (ECF subfamily)